MHRKILGVFLRDVGLGYPYTFKYAYVVELADTQDLGSCSVKSAGSSPVISTSNYLTVAMLIYLSGRRLLMA